MMLRLSVIAFTVVGGPFAYTLVQHGTHHPPTPFTQPFLNALNMVFGLS